MWKFVFISAIAASLLLATSADTDSEDQCGCEDYDCPDDQELSDCPDSSCFPLTCDEVGNPLPGCGPNATCPEEPTCVCKDGKVFDENDCCVDPKECPSCGGDENAVYGCGTNCGKKCSDLVEKQSICALSCKINGCDCRDNFYYDSNKKRCVPADECTSICTNPNEEYVKCPDCSPQTCATRDAIYHCPRIPANQSDCTGACRCKKGYFRNSKNICVLANECDDCPEGQEYSTCPDASCGPLTCAEAGFDKKNCGTSDPCPGQPGCVCKAGYLKDCNGKCIKSSDCPSCGGDDNAIPGCSNYCGRRCSDIGKTGVFCPLFCKVNGCACKPNYYYDTNINKCVAASKCTPTCKPNEVFSDCENGLCRVQDCKDKGKIFPCQPIDPTACTPGCVCPRGFLRNAKRECVPEDQCETPSCKPNEEYSSCSNGLCRVQDCKDKGKTRPCPPMVPGSCLPGCVCPQGSLRNAKGECVPENRCEITCSNANEEYVQCPDCSPQTCATRNNIYNCPMIPANQSDCTGACRCKKGYFRNSKNICVLANECEPQCDDGEIYSTCPPVCCDAEYCPKDRNAPQSCPAPKECPKKGRCVCGFNSHRDRKSGKCIPTRNCPPFACKKRHEVYDSCPPVCPGQTCSDYLNNATCPKYPIGIVVACKPACRCKPGYYRNDQGDCVTGQQCKGDCPDDQELSDCPESSCFPLNCEEVGNPLPKCGSNSSCTGEPTCVCKDGKVFDENYCCVDPRECPSCGGDKNAVYGCGTNCGKKCSDLVKNQSACPRICKINGCDCRDNFYYDSNKKRCVPADECTSICTNPNEEYAKCPDCSPQTCEARDAILYCPRIPTNQSDCVGSCRCKKGFFRNSKNICVTASECDDCPEGQEYSTCPDASCGPLTCAEAGFNKKNCGTSDPCPGQPGCVCKAGYLKDCNGKCIKSSDCPSCGGDDNAIPGCSNYCGRRCSDIGKTGGFCPLFCLLNGCACKPNYYYDTNINKCVAASKCTPTCKPNEEFSSCSNGLCRVQDCKDKGKTRPCPPMAPGSCLPGCVCPQGSLRNAKGECVPENQCEITCANANEEYVQCPDCSPQTCATRNNIYHCPMIPANQSDCTGACRCKKGYFRNSKNICVLANDCEPQCDDGEIYSTCPPVCCDAEYCPKNRNAPQSCPAPKECPKKGRCVCGFNSHRDRKSGKCIPTRTCPPFACKKRHEVYDSCPPVCPGQTCSDYLNNATCSKYPIRIVVACKPACRCKPGYYRNDQGDCISGQQCQDEQENSDCGDSTTPDNPSQPTYTCTDVAGQEQLLEDGSNGFTLKFLTEQVKNNPVTSVFSSPSSIMSLMGILAAYSNGSTFTEIMNNVLNLKTKDQIRCAFPPFLLSFQVAQGTELDLTSSIYVADQYKLSASLSSDAVQVFNASVQSINFNQATQAANTINKQVSDATKGKITQLVSSDMFDASTRLLLLSAIYFKGTWKTEFNPNNTQESDFYVSEDKTIKVQMMYQKNKFKYLNNNEIDAQFVEIPYQDQNVSCIVVLPNQRYGLLNVLNKLQDPAISKTFLNSLTLQTLTLFLPKFELKTTTNLVDTLKSIGVKTIFNANAELKGMIVPDEPLYVSDAIQKAYVSLSEEGTTAAAASAFVVSTRAAVMKPPEIVFKADHPFIFCIKNHNLILFIGVFNG